MLLTTRGRKSRDNSGDCPSECSFYDFDPAIHRAKQHLGRATHSASTELSIDEIAREADHNGER